MQSIAVDEQIQGAGASVWWALEGRVHLDALRAAWTAEGLPEDWLPEAPSPEQRLGRAVRKVSDLRHLARPVTRRGHWALVDETVVEGADGLKTVSHSAELTVWIKPGETAPRFGGVAWTLQRTIAEAFHASEGILERDDLALWLVEVLDKRLHAVPLRPRGGFYYVLPEQLGRWRAIEQVIGAVGLGTAYAMPTLRGADVRRAVLDALQREVTEQAAAIQAALTDGTQKGRALRSRVSECSTTLDKLAQYDALLGDTLAAVRAQIEVAQDAALQAALKVEAEAEAEAEAKKAA